MEIKEWPPSGDYLDFILPPRPIDFPTSQIICHICKEPIIGSAAPTTVGFRGRGENKVCGRPVCMACYNHIRERHRAAKHLHKILNLRTKGMRRISKLWLMDLFIDRKGRYIRPLPKTKTEAINTIWFGIADLRSKGAGGTANIVETEIINNINSSNPYHRSKKEEPVQVVHPAPAEPAPPPVTPDIVVGSADLIAHLRSIEARLDALMNPPQKLPEIGPVKQGQKYLVSKDTDAHDWEVVSIPAKSIKLAYIANNGFVIKELDMQLNPDEVNYIWESSGYNFTWVPNRFKFFRDGTVILYDINNHPVIKLNWVHKTMPKDLSKEITLDKKEVKDPPKQKTTKAFLYSQVSGFRKQVEQFNKTVAQIWDLDEDLERLQKEMRVCSQRVVALQKTKEGLEAGIQTMKAEIATMNAIINSSGHF